MDSLLVMEAIIAPSLSLRRAMNPVLLWYFSEDDNGRIFLLPPGGIMSKVSSVTINTTQTNQSFLFFFICAFVL